MPGGLHLARSAVRDDPAAVSEPAGVQRLLKRFCPDSPIPPTVRSDVAVPLWARCRCLDAGEAVARE